MIKSYRIILKMKSIEEFMKGVINDAYAILFLLFLFKACVVDIHLNFLDLSRRLK